MPSKNLGEIYTDQGAFLFGDAATGDLIYWWDVSAAGVARSRAMDRKNLLLLTNQGVDIQRSASKPTLRGNGDALAAGDRWWDTSDLRWWFWNGTYWLSEEQIVFTYGLSAAVSANLTTGGIVVNSAGNDLFLLSFAASLAPAAGTFDGSNKWDLNLRRSNSSNTAAVISTLSLNSGAGGNRVFLQNTLGNHLDVSALDIGALQVNWIKTGSPGNLGADSSLRIIYRLAKP